MTRLKITTVGNSAGIVLPKEMLAKLRVEKGDTLLATETPQGFEISAYDSELEQQMEVAETVMRDYRDTLRLLAE
jgi:putative addiction module antidote